jgi:hypothetical protein
MSAKRSCLLSAPVDCVLADAWFDPERSHTFCREQLKADSIIPAKHFTSHRATGIRQQMRENFPSECRFVLELLGQVYGYDAEARERGLTPDERLQLHQQRSRPVMDRLHAWLEAQLAERKTEPNSGLGQAISYLLRHWHPLTLFLRKAGAPLDNNIAEWA